MRFSIAPLILVLTLCLTPCFSFGTAKNQTDDQTVQKVTFRLLAIEQDSDNIPLRSAQHLIETLTIFSNWQNNTVSDGFRYLNYIHLLSNVNYSDINPDCQPYYKGTATRANVIKEISTFFNKVLPGENGDFSIRIFYYIGHSNKAVRQGITSYYLALDDPIFDWELNQILPTSKPQNSNSTLIILDTAYSAGYIAKLASPGRVILTASSPDETAKRWISLKDPPPSQWGWFTGHEKALYENNTIFGPLGIIGGIRNASDVNSDGWRSAAEVFQFAHHTTMRYANNQTDPITQKSYGLHPQASYGVAGGEIPFIQHNASKPFPHNAKACTPLPDPLTSALYQPEEFEHRMYRRNPNHTGFTSSLGPETPDLLWFSSLNGPITGSAAVADGLVFVGTMGGLFFSLELATGEVVWDFPAGSPISSSPAIVDGIVFFGTHEPGKIYALDEYSGLVRWIYEIPNGAGIDSSPTVVDGMVFICSSDGVLRALTQFEGKLLWVRYLGGREMRARGLAVADGMVFIGSSAFDEYTGALIWRYMTDWQVISSPAVVEGTVYIGAQNDDHVYALDEWTGVLKWDFWAGGWFSSPAVDTRKNLVIVGNKAHRLYGLNKKYGIITWEHPMGSNYLSAPTISANGLVYVGDSDGNLHCIDEDTGQEVWKYTTGDSIVSSPIVIHEHLLITSQDGNIYCFGPPFPVHNVAVADTNVSPVMLKHGNSVAINYTVENKGSVSENVTIMFAYNNSNVWTAPEYLEPTIIHNITTTLAPGFNLTNIYTWGTTDIPPGAYGIWVQAVLLSDEVDASDNTYNGNAVILLMLSDIDANGKVNIIDVALAAKAFGSEPGDENWNPNADLDNNNVITIFDISRVAKDFGIIYL